MLKISVAYFNASGILQQTNYKIEHARNPCLYILKISFAYFNTSSILRKLDYETVYTHSTPACTF